MEELEFMEIDVDKIPYRFEIELDNKIYEIEVNYNPMHDFFTVDLYKDGEILIVGEKIVYGYPLFRNIIYKDVPEIDIVPFDTSLEDNRVGFEEMSDTIYLYIVGDNNETVA